MATAGKLRGIATPQFGELHQIEQFLDTTLDRGGRWPVLLFSDAQPEADVVGDGHVFEQGVLLKHEADPPFLHTETGGVDVAEQNLPAVRRLQPGDGAQQGGFAGTGGPEQRQQFAGSDVEIDAAQRVELTVVLLDIANLDIHCRSG
jgi:hypothetical protein